MLLNCGVRDLQSPLDRKKIRLVNPKENQPWIFTGRTVAEAEAPIFWPLCAKSWPIGKDSDAGKDWRQRIRMRWLDNITNSMDMSLSKSRRQWRTEEPGLLQFIGLQSWTWLSDWTPTGMTSVDSNWSHSLLWVLLMQKTQLLCTPVLNQISEFWVT